MASFKFDYMSTLTSAASSFCDPVMLKILVKVVHVLHVESKFHIFHVMKEQLFCLRWTF